LAIYAGFAVYAGGQSNSDGTRKIKPAAPKKRITVSAKA